MKIHHRKLFQQIKKIIRDIQNKRTSSENIESIDDTVPQETRSTSIEKSSKVSVGKKSSTSSEGSYVTALSEKDIKCDTDNRAVS